MITMSYNLLHTCSYSYSYKLIHLSDIGREGYIYYHCTSGNALLLINLNFINDFYTCSTSFSFICVDFNTII